MINYEDTLRLLRNRIKEKLEDELPVLRGLIGNWQRRHYRLIADKISQNLRESKESGEKNANTRVSVSTLLRLFKYGYILNTPTDARTINVLNKLCLYIGYSDWAEFLNGRNMLFDNRFDIAEFINKACASEFNAYSKLPIVFTEGIEKFFMKNSSAYNRINNLLYLHSEKKWVINNERNPSTYEILDVQLVKARKNYLVVRTEEYWYLRWYSLIQKKYVFIYDKKNFQDYKLVKEDVNWMIEMNAYPD
jgi:hypothetical protein